MLMPGNIVVCHIFSYSAAGVVIKFVLLESLPEVILRALGFFYPGCLL